MFSASTNEKSDNPICTCKPVALFASVVVLSFLVIINSYFNTVSYTAEERYQRILHVQKSFVDVLSLEQAVPSGAAHYATLLGTSQDVIVDISREPEHISLKLLKERQLIFSKLLQASDKNFKYYSSVRETFLELIAGIRFIHEYHIDKLKNGLQRGEEIPTAEAGSEFQRSPVRSATELDIINLVVKVQSSLLDVVSVFYEMQ